MVNCLVTAGILDLLENDDMSDFEEFDEDGNVDLVDIPNIPRYKNHNIGSEITATNTQLLPESPLELNGEELQGPMDKIVKEIAELNVCRLDKIIEEVAELDVGCTKL
jgi:hypothetical protein